MQAYCEQLPKIELHAHLNGSLSSETLRELGCSSESVSEYQLISSNSQTLDNCFKLFKIAHEATSSREAIYKAAKSVINEFHKDNCVYLELRTTPRAETNMTKKEYVESIVKAISENTSGIIVKLILSIDRRHDLETSYETLGLAKELNAEHGSVVVGLDLCGNPNEGFFPKAVFEEAREAGLKVTLHCGEVVNEKEVYEMLEFKPDRLGHATFIHPKYKGSEKCWESYVKNPIPVECCLTSNVICGTVPKYENHHLLQWIQQKLPFSLSTDDKGVFCTSLSNEYFLASRHFGLLEDDLWKISFQSIDYSFASEGEKSILREKLNNWRNKFYS